MGRQGAPCLSFFGWHPTYLAEDKQPDHEEQHGGHYAREKRGDEPGQDWREKKGQKGGFTPLTGCPGAKSLQLPSRSSRAPPSRLPTFSSSDHRTPSCPLATSEKPMVAPTMQWVPEMGSRRKEAASCHTAEPGEGERGHQGGWP